MNIIKNKLLSIMITVALVMTSLTTISANDSEDIGSFWAVEDIKQAISLGLVPAELQSDYSKTMSRLDFCTLIVALIQAWDESIYSEALNHVNEKIVSFDDCTDINVKICVNLGIVEGVGNNLFNPEASIKRQEAAKILWSTLAILSNELAVMQEARMPHLFEDGGEIRSWAREKIYWAYYLGIMTGVGDNKFKPNGEYTREQAILTTLRLYQLKEQDPSDRSNRNTEYYPLGRYELGHISGWLDNELNHYTAEEIGYCYPRTAKYGVYVDSTGVGSTRMHLINNKGEKLLTDLYETAGIFRNIQLSGDYAQIEVGGYKKADGTDVIYAVINLETGQLYENKLLEDIPAIQKTKDSCQIVGNSGYYTLYNFNGTRLSKTYSDMLTKVADNIYAGWVGEGKYEFLYCDGINEARLIITGYSYQGLHFHSDGGGVYALQTNEKSVITFDAFGDILGQITLSNSSTVIGFVNGLIVSTSHDNGQRSYHLANGREIRL
ncbi:MAG: hypothetical protein CVU98_05975 [Firmicutes bacterium HGW-Firmicutes-3]|jgi:hypothetical protein|nr:MAG: hypothetical protein CVU98_05975 [Firmicutes bacterium HGW-Firmicutes-3]